jgi:hypothetical protein
VSLALQAVRLEFWRSRKGFDDQLGKLVEKIQKATVWILLKSIAGA